MFVGGKVIRITAQCLVGLLWCVGMGCARQAQGTEGSNAAVMVARGVPDVAAELRKMPPYLREQFEGEAGRAELTRALADKQLLAEEARRRGLHQSPDIARQVRELEDRLVIQALVAQEQGTRPAQEPRAWFDVHKQEFQQPARLRLVRVLVRAPVAPEASPAVRKAMARAEVLRAQLVQGRPALEVGRQGEGPEAVRGGDLGFLTPAELPEARASNAVALLEAVGDVSPVTRTDDGLAVFAVTDVRPARIPPFEEVRSQVEARMQPMQQRQAFNALLERLRGGRAVVSQGAP